MKPATLAALGILLVAALGLAALCVSGLSKKAKAGQSLIVVKALDEETGKPVPSPEIWITRIGPKGRARPVRAHGHVPAGDAAKALVEAVAPGYAPRGIEVEVGASGWQGEIRLKPLGLCAPLPHGRGRLALTALGQAEGWDLENAKPSGPEGADLLPLPAPGTEGIAALGGANGARLARAEESAVALEAPAEGYAVTADLGAGASAFFVRTRSGRYAKIYLLKRDTPESLDFEWVFQPDGSRTLGGGKR